MALSNFHEFDALECHENDICNQESIQKFENEHCLQIEIRNR